MTQKFDYINHYKIDAEEFNYFEERTGATEHDERRVHEYITSCVRNSFKTILDVGAGSAWVADTFVNKNLKVTSLDLSMINVEKAKDIIPNNKHSQIVADSFKLPFKNNSYDVIIASEIIEHVIDPKGFVKELFRVVKPKGKLIITTPYKEILRYYLCIHCNQKTPVHAHIHSFDENILSLLCDDKSLANVHWKTFGNKLLIFLRTYVVLKYLPFGFWNLIDSMINKIKSIPAHILIEYHKR